MPSQVELGVSKKPEPEKSQQEEKAPFNLLEFLKEVRVEFTKVSWPSREQVTNEFFSVLVLVSILTGIIFLLDKLFGIIVNFFTGRLF